MFVERGLTSHIVMIGSNSMCVSEVCVLNVTGFAKRDRILHLYKLFNFCQLLYLDNN